MIHGDRLEEMLNAVVSQQEFIGTRQEVSELIFEVLHRRRMQQILESMLTTTQRTATERFRDVCIIAAAISLALWFGFFA